MSKEEQEKYMNMLNEAFSNNKIKQMLVMVEFDDEYAQNNEFVEFGEGENKAVVEYNVETEENRDAFIDITFNSLDGLETQYPLLTSMKKKGE